MKKLWSHLAAVTVVALGLTISPAAPALASAEKCVGAIDGSCVAVNGTGLHVNWFKSRVAIYANTCLYGHSQLLINGAHYADSNGGGDKAYCSSSIFGARVTTGTWTVNRDYAKGTKICSKFWLYDGGNNNNGYTSLGTACATIG